MFLSPLSPLPGPNSLPVLRSGRSHPPPRVQVTTLPSGLRIATQENYGQIATLALFVDAGSMYESEADGEIGACHFLETCAFQSTERRTASDILRCGRLQSELFV